MSAPDRVVNNDLVFSRAGRAADRLFEDPDAEVDYEPGSVEEATVAVAQLAARFAGAGGTVIKIIENARAGAEVLSGDRLQGLGEIVQNADDVGARTVRFLLDGNDLLVVHDGRPITLRDIHALASPWLTTKRRSDSATGRFGIGLTTLYALAESFEVHCGHYHVRCGDPTVASIPVPDLPTGFAGVGTTVFRVRLEIGSLDPEDLDAWASRWDDTALLFCSTVDRVSFTTSRGSRALHLSWKDFDITNMRIGGQQLDVRRQVATASGGRSWVVRSIDVPSPAGLSRAHKATGPTTPIAVALPLAGGSTEGQIYAGLPIVATRFPLRANAQFDPIASRQALADRPWNDALASLLADLWTGAVLDLFAYEPIAAWDAIPLPDPANEGAASGPVARLEALLLAGSRTTVANTVNLVVAGEVTPISQLAVEVPRLSGLLTPDEIAGLAGLPAALPTSVRDGRGRWRAVLDDWRSAGAVLPAPVTIADALPLVGEDSRTPSATIALSAAAVSEGFGAQLALIACVVDADGNHNVPPNRTSAHAFSASGSGLAAMLGMTTELHEAHLAENDQAKIVHGWLESRHALIDATDARAVLGRLSAAGHAGNGLADMLHDEQLQALRDAFEPLGQADWSAFGPGVGRAVTLEAFRFDNRGRKVPFRAHPHDAYLPKSIDREPDSFSFAADTTTDITWLASRYSTVLKSSLGRVGLGPQKFLHLLGAETAPRVVPHPMLDRRYGSEASRGLAYDLLSSPVARTGRLQQLGADYTLEDRYSPDLEAVLIAISRDRKPTRRRKRAIAILATLGRAWPSIGDAAEVAAVQAHYGWRHKESTPAWWLWKAATIPWLDDASSKPTVPLDLRLRTQSTVAVHGSKADGYLHVAFAEARRDVLAALGVTGEPSTADLVDRLRELRDHSPADDDSTTDTAVVYQALAERLGSRTRMQGDLGPAALRKAFGQGRGLIRTAAGWRPPLEVLGGPPIFADLRTFVPQVADTDRLWLALQLRLPGVDDAVEVLAELARAKGSAVANESVVLETLRLLVRLAGKAPANAVQPRRLSKLPVWTTQGWTTTRPVYAVDDPMLASGLADDFPVWLPGGDLSQFKALIGPLRLTEIPASSVVLVETETEVDEEATVLFASAVGLLREDLTRNDPATGSALRVGWAHLADLEVRTAPNLRVRVEGDLNIVSEVSVPAIVDPEGGAIFFTDPDALATVDGGGRVVAGLFDADRRRVAQAWLAAIQEAKAGREAARLELSADLASAEAAATQANIETKLADLQRQAAGRRAAGGATSKEERRGQGSAARGMPGHPGEGATAGAAPNGTVRPPGGTEAPPRVLVDPDSLHVVDADGKIVSPGGGNKRLRDGNRTPGALPDPRPGGATPRGSSAARTYTDLEKETLGLTLARMVLASDADDMIDLRAQHGVGADAVDKLSQFYELKVSAGSEPDRITLEPSEIRRAMSTPDFFLIVVSGVEGSDATPKVRVIVDPLSQLRMVKTSQVRLDGVRSSHSLVFELAPEANPPSTTT